MSVGQSLKSFHQCSQIQSLNKMGAFRAFSHTEAISHEYSNVSVHMVLFTSNTLCLLQLITQYYIQEAYGKISELLFRINEHFRQISSPFLCSSLSLDIHTPVSEHWMDGLVCMRGAMAANLELKNGIIQEDDSNKCFLPSLPPSHNFHTLDLPGTALWTTEY